MHHRQPSARTPAPSHDPEVGKAGCGDQKGHGHAGLEAALAVMREQIDRLETDVRNLQSQLANRS